MKTTASIEIDCAIQDVFELTNDHIAEWSSVVVEDTVIEETPEVVGSTFRSVTVSQGREMVFEGVVTQYESPRLCVCYLTGEMFDIDVAYFFEDLGAQRTKVTQVSNVLPKGGLKIFFFLFGWAMKSAGRKDVEKEMNNLKVFCEQYEKADS